MIKVTDFFLFLNPVLSQFLTSCLFCLFVDLQIWGHLKQTWGRGGRVQESFLEEMTGEVAQPLP